MKTVMAKTSLDMSSKRHFHRTNKVGTEDEAVPTSQSVSKLIHQEKKEHHNHNKVAIPEASAPSVTRLKLQAVAISRVRSVLSVFSQKKHFNKHVVGTLFGNKHGHVHFAFQRDPTSQPSFLIEISTPISGLVREMASGLVRISLECDKEKETEKKTVRLVEEPLWRTYCNGKKCGFGTKRECGVKEWNILKSVEPISMGAGVLPGNKNGSEVMYMRAKFERIVGSRDSEAFYMMNPDRNGAHELSIYLLRV